MGMVKYLAKNTFKKIFRNLAAELECPESAVQIGIYFIDGAPKFYAFKNMIKIKEIELDDYCGSVVDFTGGTAVIQATIAQSGPKYARELSAPITDVSVIMRHRDDALPDAVLLNGNVKARKIDIEQEFLNN